MKHSIRSIIKTNILLGLFAILPITIIFIFIKFAYGFIYSTIAPIMLYLNISSGVLKNASVGIAILAFFIIAFLLGLIVRTRIGGWIFNFFESATLIHIPGYKAIKETIEQFKSKDNKSGAFSQVAFFDPYGSDALMLGFITDEHNKRSTVFAPSSPNPTSGYVFHIKKEKVYVLKDCKMEEGMRAIISCGMGAETLFEKLDKLEDNQDV